MISLFITVFFGIAILSPQHPATDKSTATKQREVSQRQIQQTQPREALSVQANPQQNKTQEKESNSKAESQDRLYKTYLISGPIIGIIAFATGILVCIQIRAIKQIERAWIVVSTEEPHTMQKNKGTWILTGFGFDWYAKNCGKTPAFIVKVSARIHPVKSLSDLPKEPFIEKSDIHYYGVSVSTFPYGLSIGPSEVIPWYTFADPKDKQPTTIEEWNEVREGKLLWVAYGIVEYKLAFHRWRNRQTRFCYVWTPEAPDKFTRSALPQRYTKQT
jgi:hypothetical protein